MLLRSKKRKSQEELQFILSQYKRQLSRLRYREVLGDRKAKVASKLLSDAIARFELELAIAEEQHRLRSTLVKS